MVSPFYFSILTISAVYVSILEVYAYVDDIKSHSIIYRQNGGNESNISRLSVNSSAMDLFMNPFLDPLVHSYDRLIEIHRPSDNRNLSIVLKFIKQVINLSMGYNVYVLIPLFS